MDRLQPDGSVQGRPWGIVIDQKYCHSYRAQPHWHVVHEYNGELFVWNVAKRIEDAECRFRDGVFEPQSGIGTAFLDACMLKTHPGCPDFFQGKVFDLVRDEEVRTTIEDIKVSLDLSRHGRQLLAAKQGWSYNVGLEKAEKELKDK
ncbi:hypothetical protein [Kitasatospora sp. NPDC004531]